MGGIPSEARVLKARPVAEGPQAPLAPTPIEDVVATIRAEQPDLVFAPHVETSAGMMLPDDYLRAVAEAVHEHGGLFVLDCIASGTVWVDMAESGVDVLISAPQKGWTGSPCCGLVMLSPAALARLAETTSTSFACDLKKWYEIMQAYEAGGHAYHATMPTDGLRTLRDVMQETLAAGREQVRQGLLELGARVREALERRGYRSVAAPGFQAPGVIVSYTDDDVMKTGRPFAELGIQVAAGVPLMCDEPEDFRTFRIGLFGLDKLADIDRTVATLEQALDRLS
jgi:aspartate aminotransferase-like enzyme